MMTDDSITPILYQNEKARHSAQSGATTDDPITTMLIKLRSQIERREHERQKPWSSKRKTPEEMTEVELKRLLEDPNTSVREVENFHDKLAYDLFAFGSRSVSDNVERALQAKVAQVRGDNKRKNR